MCLKRHSWRIHGSWGPPWVSKTTLVLKTNLIYSHFACPVPVFPRDSLLSPYYKSMGVLTLSVVWLNKTQIKSDTSSPSLASFLFLTSFRTLRNTNAILFINHCFYVNILHMFWQLKCYVFRNDLLNELMKRNSRSVVGQFEKEFLCRGLLILLYFRVIK